MKFSCLFFIIGINLCFSQKLRVENKLTNCWYNSFGSDALKVKDFINDYEQLLIKEQILEDNTPKSYINILNVVANGKNYKKPSKSFHAEIEKMNLSIEGFNECESTVTKDSLKYNVKRLQRYEMVFDSIMNIDGYTRTDLAKGILSVLDKEDFDLEYYRVRTFLIFDFIILSEIWDFKFPKNAKTISKGSLKSAFYAHADKHMNIFLEGDKIDIQDFRKKVKEYMLAYKSNSAILISVEKDILYKDYQYFQEIITDEILSLRKEYSLKKYNTNFQELSELLKKEISEVFPENIVEKRIK